ncbi:hypothetical protein CDAR_252391 [Caerostris darwini]|uniref:Uncharacterized protein n=1 Tax=Caerostris darwini TaxID=1538125 RepID=A0AAV4WHG0_9ARAC|nr:hypothetical protein CDAR_252391 [Caerostris darwini]
MVVEITCRYKAHPIFGIAPQEEIQRSYVWILQWVHLVRSIAAEMFRPKKDKRLNSSAVGLHPAGTSHLAAKRVAGKNKLFKHVTINGTSYGFFHEEKMVTILLHIKSHLAFIFLSLSRTRSRTTLGYSEPQIGTS